MPIGYSPWTDAATYGRELGNSLSQAMIQIPFQKRQQGMEQERIGLEGRQIDNQLAIKKMLMELNQQRYNDLAQYHEGLIDAKNQGLMNTQQLNDERNRHWSDQLAFQQAVAQNKQDSWKNDVMPVNGGIVQHYPGMQVAPQPQGAFGPMAQGGMTPDSNVFQPYPKQFAPVNPNADMRNQLEMLKLKALIGGTNMYPQVLNQLQQLQGQGNGNSLQPGIQQTNRVPTLAEYMQMHQIQ